MEISVPVLRKYLLVFYKCSPFLPFSTIFQVDHLHVVTFVKIVTIPKAISYSNFTPYICYVKCKKAGLQERVKFDRDSIESDETVSWLEWRIYQKITINTSKLSLSASNKLGENFRRVCSVLRIGITWNWLYRNFDRLFRFFFFSTSNWGDGGRDFFFQLGSTRISTVFVLLWISEWKYICLWQPCCASIDEKFYPRYRSSGDHRSNDWF